MVTEKEYAIYAEFVRILFAKHNKGVAGLLHASIGAASEAGELLDAVKKHWVYGKPFDVQNAIEEIGDQLFYLQALCNLIGTSFSEVIQANVRKLNARYPGGYTDAAAIERADKQ